MGNYRTSGEGDMLQETLDSNAGYQCALVLGHQDNLISIFLLF